MRRTIFLILLLALPFQTHASNKISELLQNKTFDGIDHLTNLSFKQYFTDYGLVYSKTNHSGRWYVKDDRICITWYSSGASACYDVELIDNDLKFYNKTNNDHKLHFTLKNPRPGNHFNLIPDRTYINNSNQSYTDEKHPASTQNKSSQPGTAAHFKTKTYSAPYFSVKHANVTWDENQFTFLGNKVIFDEDDKSAMNFQFGFPVANPDLTIGANIFYQSWDVKSDSGAPGNSAHGSAKIITASCIIRYAFESTEYTRIYLEGGGGIGQLRLRSYEGYTDVKLEGITFQFSGTVDLHLSKNTNVTLSLTHKEVFFDDVNGNEFENSANIVQVGLSFNF